MQSSTSSSVVLNADGGGGGGGDGGACGGEPERLSESSGTIKSPGYDSSTYPNDATCQWIIEAPAGKVRLMSTQSVYYYLSLIHI